MRSESLVAQLRAGFDAVRRRRWVAVTAIYLGVLSFFFNGPMFVLGSAIALSKLRGSTAWAMILSFFGIGLIGGSLIAQIIMKSRSPLGISFLLNLCAVPFLYLMGESRVPWIVAASASFAGLAIANFGTTYPALLQQTIPNELISRVGSYFWLARIAQVPIALAIAPPFADHFGSSKVFEFAALLVCIATIFASSSRDVWRVRNYVVSSTSGLAEFV